MPIEFAPPAPNLQPFNVGAPQTADPLQTLAQMGALRAQNMQGQAAALQLQQARMQMNSNQALLTAMANGGGDWDKTMQLARESKQVLPTDMFSIQQHRLNMQKEATALDESQRKDMLSKMDEYNGLLEGVTNQPELDAVNREATRRGLFNFPMSVQSFTPLQQYDDQHLKAYRNGLIGHAAAVEEASKKSKQDLERAQAAEAAAKGEEAKAATLKGQREQMIFDLQTAPKDPATGTPTPAAEADLRRKYPTQLPPRITKDWIDQAVRATVPAEKQPEYDFRTQNGVIGTDQFQTIFLPAYAQNLGKKTVKDLTPAERMAAFTVFKQYDTNPEALQSLLQSRALTAQMHNLMMQNTEFQRGQQSYQFQTGRLDKLAKPTEDLIARFSRLKDTLAQNTPQADALVAPELMTVMAGGMGSGLRMNEAEISRVVGGRSKWEDLSAALNKWKLDPTKALSITPEQRREIGALMDAVGAKMEAKRTIVTDARNELLGSNDPMQHRQIVAKAEAALQAVDTPGASTGAPKATHRYNPATGKIEVIQDGGQNR